LPQDSRDDKTIQVNAKTTTMIAAVIVNGITNADLGLLQCNNTIPIQCQLFNTICTNYSF